MQLRKPMPPKQAELIEELVSWNCKIKTICWALRSITDEADIANYSRAIYAAMGVSPPRGSTASASQGRVIQQQQYTVMAVDFMNMLARGASSQDAMFAAFRHYHREVRSSQLDERDRCQANVWFDLSRELQTRRRRLVRCPHCGGQQILDFDSSRATRTCTWCSAPLLASYDLPKTVTLQAYR
jgi:hypothetical protein